MMSPARSSLRGRLLANAGSLNRAGDESALHQAGVQNIRPSKVHQDMQLLYRESLAALQSKNPRLALDIIGRATRGTHVPAEYVRLHADILRLCGQRDAALAKARLAVERDNNSARAWDTLGTVLAEAMQFGESKCCYEMAISIDPEFIEARHNLAVMLQMSGCTQDAEFHYRDVIRRAPQHTGAQVNFAGLLNLLGRYEEAWAVLHTVMSHAADPAKAQLVASAIKYNQGQYLLALEHIEQSIAFAPGQTKILVRRAEILCRLGRYEQALSDCTAVLSQIPDDIEALRVKAFILRTMQRPEEALLALALAHSIRPDPEMTVDRAWILAEMGQKEHALALLDDALCEKPGLAMALYYRSYLGKHGPKHPDVAAMEDIVANNQASGKDRMRLSFALGKIYLDAGEGKKAFAYLDQANALKRSSIFYDRNNEERWFAAITELFSLENLAQMTGSGIGTNQPIFVFGMPRSGTTLVEQILASHPSVRGNGETPYLDMLARSAIFKAGPAGLSAENLKACASQYLEAVGANHSLYFVDKTTSNYLYAGLISILLPGARMIHCRRDALDTCLSCYTLLFGHGHEFSYRQDELGHYYGLYRRLMGHWDKTLSPNTIFHVDYEKLVSRTEEMVAAILDFCGLAWDDACLRFYETKRLVTTSSLDQVRSPIYKSSIGRARLFRPWLTTLEKSLRESGV